jgi:CubicO group peptidase (beta-lactamase class C family)
MVAFRAVLRREYHIVPRILAAGLVAGLLTFPAPPQPGLAAGIDAIVGAEMARQRVPGLAVAVVRGGEVLSAKGYGLANVEHSVPVTADTIFQSGSLGKMFTSAGVMLLVEDGKIALADPVAKFLADAPAAWQAVTVRHLLTHTSGIPDYTNGPLDLRKDYTEEQLAALTFGAKLEFEPGAQFKYSNTGYLLLGMVIRKASGTFYGDVLAERVFKPLGMNTTRVISEAAIVPHRAAGYTLVKDELRNQGWVSPALNTMADGALYFSLKDLLAWDAAVRGGRLLSPASWNAVFQPVRLTDGKTFGYGFGWAIGTRGGQTVYRHGGAWQGFKTHYAVFHRGNVSIMVLANLQQADPGRIVDLIAASIDPALAQ